MSMVKSLRVKDKTSRVVGAIADIDNKSVLFVCNKTNGVFYALGYNTAVASYKDLFEAYSDVKPIYEGDSITLEF